MCEDFLKSPFSASLSRGNLVDGLPRGVSTEAMSASWIFQGGAPIHEKEEVFQRFCVICDIDLLGNFEKAIKGH